MRIFDWIHRKFHRNVDYCMVSHNKDVNFASHVGKKPTAVTCEQQETEALLFREGHVALVDLLDWHGGLLAIGTLGLDPFAFDDPEYSARQKVDSVAGDFPHPLPIADGDLGPEESPDLTPLCWPHAAGGVLSRPMIAFDCTGGACEIVAEAGKKAERTTLADLFSADAEGEKREAEEAATGLGTCEKGKGHVRGLAKKLVSWNKGEDSRPTAKLRGLFTKMLRRKIHPELQQEGHVGVFINRNCDKGGPKSENPALQKESTIICGEINE